LAVLSSTPDSGVPITISPLDNNGQASGTTPFNRRYDKDTLVSLEAPAAIGCNSFVRWERDGNPVPDSASTSLRMEAQHSMRAVYAPRGPRVIHVDCTYTGGGADGSAERPFQTVGEANNAACNGDTLRIRVCNYPETITMNKALRLESASGIVNIGR
jgi:hypothetical protein